MENRQTQSTRHGEEARQRGPVAFVLLLAASAFYGLVRFASWADPEKPAASPPPRPGDGSAAAKPAPEDPDETPSTQADPAKARPAEARRSTNATRSSRRRLGGALVFATLFFAGAALSAIAGDTVGSLGASGQVAGAACGDPAAAPAEEDPTADEPADACETGETETGEATPDAEAGAEPPPDAEGAPPATTEPETEPGGEPPPADGGSEPAGEGEPSDPSGGGDPAPPPPPGADDSGGNGTNGGTRNQDPPLLDAARPPAPRTLDPEAGEDSAVVWLHRILPDPTPPARRLAPGFARELRTVGGRHHVPWSLLLGVVRAHGNTGRVPVGPRTLARIAAELAAHRDALGAYRPWHIALRYSGRTVFADRTLALDRYNRAVGLRGLVIGLAAAKRALAARVLADRGIVIYAGGRADIAGGRTDVRLLVLLRYLRIAHGSVTISSLTSGHGVYSRPGVVSAHTYGLAVDIAALGGRAIAGNQEPHGVTERAVRSILLLPAELAPQQVISLLGLGGASFPLADHDDHIHVGY